MEELKNYPIASISDVRFLEWFDEKNKDYVLDEVIRCLIWNPNEVTVLESGDLHDGRIESIIR